LHFTLSSTGLALIARTGSANLPDVGVTGTVSKGGTYQLTFDAMALDSLSESTPASAVVTVATDPLSGQATEQKTRDAAGNFIEDVTWNAGGTVETDYASGTATEQKTRDTAGNFVKDVTWNAGGTVETDYVAGKAAEQTTWDSAGNFVKDVTWSAAGTAETDYANGQATEQKTWDAGGNFVKDITRSDSNTVEIDYTNGKATEQTTWDASGQASEKQTWDGSGNLTQDVTWNAGKTVETDYAAGQATEKKTWDAGTFIQHVTWGASGTVETDYAGGKAAEQKTWDAGGGFVEDVTWGASGTVETDYAGGKATEQKTWDAAGNFVKDVTWGVGGTVETDYAGGKAAEKKTWDTAGNFIEDVTWSATNTVEIDYGGGIAMEGKTWDAAGNLVKDVTWGSGGTIETDYAGGKATEQKTWDAGGGFVEDVTWGAGGTVETDYAGGKATEQKTWDTSGGFVEDVTWGASGTVETAYAYGKATEQKTWDAAGNFVKDITWSASGTVETDYGSGQAPQQKIWDDAGNYVENSVTAGDGSIWYMGTASVDTANDHTLYRLFNGQLQPMAVTSAAIGSKWLSLGGPSSDLDLPKGDAYAYDYFPGAVRQDFANGGIFWTPSRGAIAISGAIWTKYYHVRDGLPQGEAYTLAGGILAQDFDSTTIVSWSEPDTYAIGKAIAQHWLSVDGPSSHFGLPTGDTDTSDDGRQSSDFKNGTIRYDPSGTISVHLFLDGYDPQGGDPNGCGPNSGARVMRYYGYPAHMAGLQSQFDAMDPVLSQVNLGAPPADLASIMKDAGYQDAFYEKGTSLDRILELLRSGKPVVAMVRVGTINIDYHSKWDHFGTSHGIGGELGSVLNRLGGSAGHYADDVVTKMALPELHWIALNGYDPVKQTISYTDTDGNEYSFSYSDFLAHWNWSTGDAVAGELLHSRGVDPGSIVY
jgi:hypothetical protein